MRIISRRAGSKLRRTGIVAFGLSAAFLAGGLPAAADATLTPLPPAHVAVCGEPGLEILTGLPGSYSCAQRPYGWDVYDAAHALVEWANQNLPVGHERRHFHVLSAATQVVAGTNYKLAVSIPGDRPEVLVGTVYRSLAGEMTVSNAYAAVVGS